MSELIDLEALAIEHLQSDHFANYLAECISTLYNQKLMDEFHNQVADEIAKKVKESVEMYVKDFEIEGDIKRIVDRAVHDITKKEILAKL